MSGYENAAATRMLATHCICCGRKLVDAVSVEAGVGPECREKYGYGEAQRPADFPEAVKHCPTSVKLVPGDARTSCNRLTYRAALIRKTDPAEMGRIVAAINALGFVKLADKVADKLARVVVTREGAVLYVRAPYNEAFVDGARQISGSRYIGKKTTQFPYALKAQVWELLKRSFRGETAMTPKGIIQIGG